MKQLKKITIYQVFTRLFGNTESANKPWGTIEENGVGKFNDFTLKALQKIKDLGITHIWFTGIIHHAVINDYTKYGISNDYPEIVKGRAGSPYAVKDYYNVNPDLAENPIKRLEEFKELIERCHKTELKVIIDIIPNHVARNYISISKPNGISDLGSLDNKNVVYHRNNNFYYNPGEYFKTPEWLNEYQVLGGESNTNENFVEFPAKWTGNGSRLSQPHFYDWYETVKLNYGISPDGKKDFDSLPENYECKSNSEHFHFWKNKDIPDTWKKMREIALYWQNMGVDGFRYDMAELVPVEFWSYLNSCLKMINPEFLLLAEVYNPAEYRNFIYNGKMDYLYDKVELYDTLKAIIRGEENTDRIIHIQNNLSDIEHHMLHFLENHDEQRIASPEFAGNPFYALPAMVLSACIRTSPTMIYFGQEVGEPAAENAGFGSSSRTSIFDYIGVPHHQRWMNNKKFDGGLLSNEELQLRNYYKKLLNFSLNSTAIIGKYQEIHGHNRAYTPWYNNHVFSFCRYSESEKLIIICNFHHTDTFGFDLEIPPYLINIWKMTEGNYQLTDQLSGNFNTILNISNSLGKTRITIAPLESFILKIN